MLRRLALLALVLPACAGKPAPTATPDAGLPAIARESAPEPLPPPPPPPAPTVEPDGNDDPVDTGAGPFPERMRFERVGRAPLSLRRMCHLMPFHGALYAAHANVPLDMDGATVTRYDPRDAAAPFTVAFDWNRPGEPTKNGGAGQGFLRVHAIGGRLFVADADPPYNGFEITEPGTEGYVYVSDREGAFAPAKRARRHPLPRPHLRLHGLRPAGPARLARPLAGRAPHGERGSRGHARACISVSRRFASQDGRTPFEVHDHFCTAPLGVLDGVLYAGSQRDGALYRIVEESGR